MIKWLLRAFWLLFWSVCIVIQARGLFVDFDALTAIAFVLSLLCLVGWLVLQRKIKGTEAREARCNWESYQKRRAEIIELHKAQKQQENKGVENDLSKVP